MSSMPAQKDWESLCNLFRQLCMTVFSRSAPPRVQRPNESQADNSQRQMYYGSNLLFVLAVGGTKISVILFLVALTATPQQRKIFHGAAATVGVWMIASFLALSLQCDLSSPWLLVDQECPGVVSCSLKHFSNSMADQTLRNSVGSLARHLRLQYHHRARYCRSGRLPCLERAVFSRKEMDRRLGIRLPSPVRLTSFVSAVVYYVPSL